MIEELKNNISKLSESEAKSLLLLTTLRIQSLKDSSASKEQILQELNSMFNVISEIQQNEKDIQREYQTIHIVCGESGAEALRVGLGREHKIIGFSDFFGMGPVWKLHQQVGQNHRYDWLKDHINMWDDIEEKYKVQFCNTLEQLQSIPENIPIVLWTAENADEQAGIRLFLHLLQEKSNTVSLINTTLAYQELFNTKDIQYLIHHTGEAHPEKLRMIYDMKRNTPLTDKEKNQLQKEWLVLSETKEVLRKWEKGIIQNVPENYYDHLLVTTAQNLHAKRGKRDFIKSARIIGQVYGELEGNVNDAFLGYRLRCLIYDGVFEMKGIPKAMRYYSVKLN